MNKQTKTPKQLKAEQTKPGAATDAADRDKVTPAAVKEEVAAMNNNPRNGDM